MFCKATLGRYGGLANSDVAKDCHRHVLALYTNGAGVYSKQPYTESTNDVSLRPLRLVPALSRQRSFEASPLLLARGIRRTINLSIKTSPRVANWLTGLQKSVVVWMHCQYREGVRKRQVLGMGQEVTSIVKPNRACLLSLADSQTCHTNPVPRVYLNLWPHRQPCRRPPRARAVLAESHLLKQCKLSSSVVMHEWSSTFLDVSEATSTIVLRASPWPFLFLF